MRSGAKFLSVEETPGVMRELSCGAPSGWCPQQDGQLFKGIFAQSVGLAGALFPEGGAKDFARAWLNLNSKSVVDFSSVVGPGGGRSFGQLWQGPFSPFTESTPWVPQASALALLLANATS